MELNNQSVVITGGASGMGNATALALIKKGLRVVVWDKQIQGFDLDAIQCDVSSADEVELALKETIARIGIPRICINCAGIAPAKRMVGKEGAMPLADFKKVIDINLVGSFNVMRVVAEQMIKLDETPDSNERGVIINTASIAAYEGQIGQTAYSASKGGIVAMTLPAARELAQYGIRVNAIAPGIIQTPLFDSFDTAIQSKLKESVPAKRIGTPDDVAYAVMTFLNPDASYLTGQVLYVCGGRSLSSPSV